MVRLIVVVVAMLAVVAGGVRGVAAQDATPTGSPMAGPCEAPALPPGTPTPMEEEASPVASPDAMAGMEMGTPEAVEQAEQGAEAAEVASPEAPMTETPGTPATGGDGDRILAGAQNVVNCLSGGTPEQVVALMTPNFTLNEFGTENPYDVLVDFEVTGTTVESLGDPQTHDDGRVSVDIVYTGIYSPNTYLHQRWFMIEDGGYFKIDEFRSLPIEGATATVDVSMVDYEFQMSQNTAPAGGVVAFNVANNGQYPHEFVVLQLPEGATIEQAFAGEVPEDQIEFYGFAFAPPGGQSVLGLTGLEAGTYTIVCFVDEPEGIPHVARGMIAEFTVE